MEGNKFYKTRDNIFYLHNYYPKRFIEHKGISEIILDYKRGYETAINRFNIEMATCLIGEVQGQLTMLKDWVICVMPSHDCGWSWSLTSSAKALSDNFDMIDGSKLLVRHTYHEKSSAGGTRTIDSHLLTMRLAENKDIKGRKIIVIDDVTTTGNSLLACRKLLLKAGAERVCLVAIGKTTTGTLLDDLLESRDDIFRNK